MLPKENINIEYKRASKNRVPQSMWETVSSFANTDGGHIYLGIAEDVQHQVLTITGITKPQKMMTNILNMQRAGKVTPATILPENMKVITMNNRRVLDIWIPKPGIHHQPVYLDNNPTNTYIRDGESDRRINFDSFQTTLKQPNFA